MKAFVDTNVILDLPIEDGKTDFGPRLNSAHELYNAFTITLVLALTVYLRQIEFIDDNLVDFINLCDIDIIKQNTDNNK